MGTASSSIQGVITGDSTRFVPVNHAYCETCGQPQSAHKEENLNHGCVYFKEKVVQAWDPFFDDKCKKCQQPRRCHLPYASHLKLQPVSCEWKQ